MSRIFLTPNHSLVKLVALWSSLFLLLPLLAACGDTPTATPVASQTTKAATVGGNSGATANSDKVAVIIPANINDGSWGSLGFEAVVKMRKELGLTVDYVENVKIDLAAYEVALRETAGKGYGLIIGQSSLFADPIKKIAPDYPNTWFVQYGGEIAGPNYSSVTVKIEEVAYLSGLAAAKAIKGNKFGVICGPKVRSEVAMVEGFRQGLLAVNPSAELFVSHLNTWDDSPGATAAATELFDKGAELILYDINNADQPVLKVAQARNKQTVNYAYDLNYVAPGNVLTSLLISVPNSMIVPAALWKNKQLEKKNYQVGLKEQAMALAPLRGKVSKEAEDQIEQAKTDISSGKLKLTIPVNP